MRVSVIVPEYKTSQALNLVNSELSTDERQPLASVGLWRGAAKRKNIGLHGAGV